MKKFRLLLAAMLAFVFTAGAWAQTFTNNGHTYEVISNQKVMLTKLAAGSTNVTVPGSVTNSNTSYTVTYISGNVVSDCKQTLTKITLPSSLTGMENYDALYEGWSSPFKGCTKLQTVDLSSCRQMTDIKPYVFKGLTCLKEVILPVTINTIYEYAFSGCTNLTSVNLAYVKSIRNHAFSDCRNLSNVSLTYVEDISDYAFSGCRMLDNLSLSYISIGSYAFENCDGLETLSLSNCTLYDGAFSGCESLENLTLQGITFIPDFTFYDCYELKSITLPNTLIYIGKSVFEDTNITDIYCLGGNTVCVDKDFYNNAEEEVRVHVPCGFTSKFKAFQGWNKEYFTFVEQGNLTLNVSAGKSNDAVFVLAGNDTWEIPLTGGELTKTLEVPESIELRVPTKYFDKVLVNGYDVTSSLQSTVVDDYTYFTISEFTATTNIHVKYAGVPFMTDKLTFYFSGDKSVGTNFNYGSQWFSAEPGSQQYTITNNGYFTRPSTLKVYFKTKNKPIVFHGSTNWSDKLTLNSSQTQYQLDINTSEITSDVFTVVFQTPVITDEMRFITFADQNVKTICINNWDTNGDGNLSIAEAANVTSIGTKFNSNSGVSITSFDELEYFTGLTDIERSAFSGCSQLSSIKLPNGLKAIRTDAFFMCYQLKEITLPEGLETIEGSAFLYCNSLKTFHVPASVNSITGNPLLNCYSVSSITVDEANQIYDSRNGCNAIICTSTKELIAGCKSTVIPENVTAIGSQAFYGCSNLTSIVLPAAITSIDNYAFSSCSALANVICKMQTPPDITTKNRVFFGINANCVLIVPAGTRDAYIAAGWTEDIFKGGIMEVGESSTLTATIIPSNNEHLIFQNSEGNNLYSSNEAAGMVELTKGSSYKLLINNTNPYYYDMHLYVNDVDCTENIVQEDDWDVLHLNNVTENILIRAVYVQKRNEFAVTSSIGGTTTIAYTNDIGGTNTANLSSNNDQRFYQAGNHKLGTPVTLTLKPDDGYEIGLVFTSTDLAIGEEEYAIVPQGNGYYKVVISADLIDRNVVKNATVFYKKTGTDVNYDVNGDGFITIADAVLIVNEILNQ